MEDKQFVIYLGEEVSKSEEKGGRERGEEKKEKTYSLALSLMK